MDGPDQFLSPHAGFSHSNSMMVGMTLHSIFARDHRCHFGVLFQRDVRGYGQYGVGRRLRLFLWFLGPLTIFSQVQGLSLDWTYGRGRAFCSESLVGHIIYGFDRRADLWRHWTVGWDYEELRPASTGNRRVRAHGALFGRLRRGSECVRLLFTVVLLATGSVQEMANISRPHRSSLCHRHRS